MELGPVTENNISRTAILNLLPHLTKEEISSELGCSLSEIVETEKEWILGENSKAEKR